MDKRIRKPAAAHELERISLGELIHERRRHKVHSQTSPAPPEGPALSRPARAQALPLAQRG
jgi:hypothetical protein